MPLKVCNKCGAKVISSDPSPTFICKACAVSQPVAAPASGSTMTCPACLASFVGRIPPATAKGTCPKCKKELALHPDGRVQTLDEYQRPAKPKIPEPVVAEVAAPEPEAVSVEAELENLMKIDSVSESAAATVALEKPGPVADEMPKDDKTKPPARRFSSGTSRFAKGKDAGRISQRMGGDQPFIKEKKPSFYVGLVLAPMLLGLVLYLGQGMESIGKLVEQAGTRTVWGINILGRKLLNLRMPTRMRAQLAAENVGIETPESGGPEGAVVKPPPEKVDPAQEKEFFVYQIVDLHFGCVRKAKEIKQNSVGKSGAALEPWRKQEKVLAEDKKKLEELKEKFRKKYGHDVDVDDPDATIRRSK